MKRSKYCWVDNPNLQEATQLAIYKQSQGAELQLQPRSQGSLLPTLRETILAWGQRRI